MYAADNLVAEFNSSINCYWQDA